MYKNLKRPLFITFPDRTVQAFDIKEDQMTDLNNTWHLHNEFELRFVQQGICNRLIGDSIAEATEGELVLLGSYLPHCWSSISELPRLEVTPPVKSLVLHFHPECLGRQFLNIPEASTLTQLFENAQRGIIFSGEVCALVSARMKELLTAKGIDKLILFIETIKLLAGTSAYELISQAASQSHITDLKSRNRIKLIYDYTFRNYKKRITITQVANLSDLSVTAFCKYFKTTTKRSYYDFLTEIRIRKACQLLMSRNIKITVIVTECGFSNISNFYRHFNNYMKMPPCEYRRVHSSISLVA